MCARCEQAAHEHGTRVALNTLSSLVVRGASLPDAVAQLKREARELSALASPSEAMNDAELSALDSMVDSAATILAMSVQQLRDTAERISPTVPDTTEGLIP